LPPRRSTLKKSLRAIERAFADIEKLFTEFTKRVRAAEREDDRKVFKRLAKSKKPRRQLHITPKRRAQLKLQGKYMGFMRQLRPAQKLRVKAVKEKRGFEAAIRLAKSLAK
jgi:GTP1/Obg family GTP-binding protein